MLGIRTLDGQICVCAALFQLPFLLVVAFGEGGRDCERDPALVAHRACEGIYFGVRAVGCVAGCVEAEGGVEFDGESGLVCHC